MNYILHLNAFLEKAEGDDTLTPYHQSLYMTLFRIWNKTGFKPTFSITRKEVMRKAHIGSKTTYYKCMKDLETAGYFRYHMSPTRYLCAMITMRDMGSPANSTVHVPETGSVRPENGTADDPQKVHFPKHPYQKLSNYSSKAKERIIGPTQEEVRLFFQQYECSPFAPISFWYHYETANWHCGGTPVKDWKALARKWLEKGATDKPDNPWYEHPDTNADTDYQQPF